jgi:hypothetical protein
VLAFRNNWLHRSWQHVLLPCRDMRSYPAAGTYAMETWRHGRIFFRVMRLCHVVTKTSSKSSVQPFSRGFRGAFFSGRDASNRNTVFDKAPFPFPQSRLSISPFSSQRHGGCGCSRAGLHDGEFSANDSNTSYLEACSVLLSSSLILLLRWVNSHYRKV